MFAVPPPSPLQLQNPPVLAVLAQDFAPINNQDPGQDLGVNFDYFDDVSVLTFGAEDIERMAEQLLQYPVFEDTPTHPETPLDFVPFVDPIPPPPPPPDDNEDEEEEVVLAFGTVRVNADVLQMSLAKWLLSTSTKPPATTDVRGTLRGAKELINACKARTKSLPKSNRGIPAKVSSRRAHGNSKARWESGVRKSCAECIKARRGCRRTRSGGRCDRCCDMNYSCLDQERLKQPRWGRYTSSVSKKS